MSYNFKYKGGRETNESKISKKSFFKIFMYKKSLRSKFTFISSKSMFGRQTIIIIIKQRLDSIFVIFKYFLWQFLNSLIIFFKRNMTYLKYGNTIKLFLEKD